MPAPSVQSATWNLLDTDVAWPRQTNASGVLQSRRSLSVTIETEADATSVASLGEWFTNAPTTISNKIVYVGTSHKSSAGVSFRPGFVVLEGTWTVENIHVQFSGQTATIRISMWQYTSTWTDVATSE